MFCFLPKTLHSWEKSLAKSSPLKGCWNPRLTLKVFESQTVPMTEILLSTTGIGYLRLGGRAANTSSVARTNSRISSIIEDAVVIPLVITERIIRVRIIRNY